MSPCLSFPPLPYDGSFAPSCLIWGKPKAVLLGLWESGKEGVRGVETSRGWEEAPLPNHNRAAMQDSRKTGQNHNGPSRSPPCVGPPPPTPPDPLPHRAWEGLVARPTAITPLSGSPRLFLPLSPFHGCRARRSFLRPFHAAGGAWPGRRAVSRERRRRRERMQTLEGSLDD